MRRQQNKVLLYWMIYISTILFYTLYNLLHTNNLSLVEDVVTLKNNFYSWDVVIRYLYRCCTLIFNWLGCNLFVLLFFFVCFFFSVHREIYV